MYVDALSVFLDQAKFLLSLWYYLLCLVSFINFRYSSIYNFSNHLISFWTKILKNIWETLWKGSLITNMSPANVLRQFWNHYFAQILYSILQPCSSDLVLSYSVFLNILNYFWRILIISLIPIRLPIVFFPYKSILTLYIWLPFTLLVNFIFNLILSDRTTLGVPHSADLVVCATGVAM